MLIGRNEHGGCVLADIFLLDFPAENRVLPLASGAGEGARVERGALVASIFEVKTIHYMIVPPITSVGERIGAARIATVAGVAVAG